MFVAGQPSLSKVDAVNLKREAAALDTSNIIQTSGGKSWGGVGVDDGKSWGGVGVDDGKSWGGVGVDKVDGGKSWGGVGVDGGKSWGGVGG